ncbi:hypothetical protein M422DRAFT_272202 [Sphaerobolus stellatus SS14]|uniref:Unplaced genomic scaffold SPHSTscaffold_285, whole genome shotgun sequence n=1 Tax=Sphaerobolus stellatus (strain SS14) TaxID=990650 RepID=A0A0C9UC39_SPHS4|nr:hypothetical protein M422DRAFT_272202 [Sphaerobolus stellatus SS14]
MAYNLIFDIVCGNIQFPENSDAYTANGTFHARINQIISLYTDAKQSSYGVRDELRASIQTVKALLPIAKQKMAAYVNAETVIWIPSRIYFDFWIRHIQELKFLQTRVAKQRPSNAYNLNISFNDAVKHIKGNNHQVQKQDRRSAKHKNKRKPPQKIQRSQGSSVNENQEIQPEQLEEDSEEVNGDPIQEQEQDQSEEESDYFNIESEDSEYSEDL